MRRVPMSTSSTTAFSFTDIQSAFNRIQQFVHRTPVHTSRTINRLVGKNVYFKCENMQKTGSFKARGAVNAVSRLVESDKDARNRGVITHSSGNHGAALSYAAQLFDVPCTVVAPNDAPAPKLDAIAAYGAQLVRCEPTLASRQSTCASIVARTGATLLHPHDNHDVMAGQSGPLDDERVAFHLQGTIAIEFLEQCPDLDAILVPTGGGGMASGIATCVQHLRPNCKVYCVEPRGKNISASFTAGRRLWPEPPDTLDTVADGMRVGNLGARCFDALLHTAQTHVFSVTDEQIVAALRLILERLKLVVEPSSGTGLAAALQPDFSDFVQAKNVGIVLCGGNLDFNKLGNILSP